MKQRGFTLIEMMIVLVMALIVISMIATGFSGMSGDSKISYGINGMTETRCIEGYKFIMGTQGNPRQILDEFGKGVRCETQSKPGGF